MPNFGSPPISQLFAETAQDPTVQELTDAELLAAAAGAQQQVANTYLQNNRGDFVVSTAGTPITPSSTSNIRANTCTGTIAGTAVTFSSPLPDALYEVTFTAPGLSYISPSNVDSRTQNGFTCYAAVDGVAGGYIAVEPV
jgi:hypothetical protein